MIQDSGRRFKSVWELCKQKTVCDGGPDVDAELEFGNPTPKSNQASTHGGCGQKQLKYKKAPLKIVLEKLNPKDDVS